MLDPSDCKNYFHCNYVSGRSDLEFDGVWIDGSMTRMITKLKDSLSHLERAERCTFLHRQGLLFRLSCLPFPLLFPILWCTFLSCFISSCRLVECHVEMPLDVLHHFIDHPCLFCAIFPSLSFVLLGFTWEGFLMRQTYWMMLCIAFPFCGLRGKFILLLMYDAYMVVQCIYAGGSVYTESVYAYGRYQGFRYYSSFGLYLHY